MIPELDIEFEAHTERSDEETLVHEWRAEQLAHLGITTIVAEAVASFVDWREVARLIARGCSPELALDIVR